MNKIVKNIAFSAMCLALCFVLPTITGGNTQIGNMISPMHVPVLVCGFICGWEYAVIVGAVAPILRSVIVGMPPMYPVALGMMFELAAYGLFAGLLYKLFPKKNVYIYPALIISMIAGRVIWGVARLIMSGVSGSEFTFAMFIAGAFTNAIPAIIIHILVIPPIVMALKKSGLTK